MTSHTQDDSAPRPDGDPAGQAIDWSRPDPVSSAVVEAVVSKTGTDAVSLPPLKDFVDGDALNRLFTRDADGRLSFEYAGLSVVVSTTDGVTVG
jgi:hypothetical protein